METVKIMGFLAAALSTTTFLPQVYKTWKCKSTTGLSLPMLLLYTLAGLCWLSYGTMIQSLPILICNAITTLVGLFLIWQKYWYHKRVIKELQR